jgi:toxin ParE1/3/4
MGGFVLTKAANADMKSIRTTYRKHPVGRHLVFYRQISINQIEIVRILHERMDVEARLAES